jgi:NAD(P)-dependent dehydrogenase (short-subunit alcohol dehydrogenase family)
MLGVKRSIEMLEGKSVLVTGSSRGIGAAIARLAHAYGAKVFLHGRTMSRDLEKFSDELGVSVASFDVRNREAIEKQLSWMGPIDVLVNNAGINPSEPPRTFDNMTDEDWLEILNVNLLGVVRVSRAVLKGMIERRSGAIVNIASIKGFTHVSGKPGYAVSKAALIQLTARMAEEFAKFGIRINAVAPGFTETEMTAKTLEDEETLGKTVLRDQIGKIPMRRMATPGEIAEAVCFLASDKASYINGQCLPVDGSLSIV